MIRSLLSYFGSEMKASVRFARNGQIYSPVAAELERLLLPYLIHGAILGANEGLGPLIAMGMGFDVALVNEAAVAFAKEFMYTGYDKGLAEAITAHSRAIVQRETAAWLESGDKIDELIRALEPTFGKARARSIAVTEVTNAIAGGNTAAWREVNKQFGKDIITARVWTTANDEVVCPICAPLGGLSFGDVAEPASIEQQGRRAVSATLTGPFTHPGGKGVAGKFEGVTYERPPAHPRCRCTLRPVIAS